MGPSDASLWERSRAGEAEAFGLLFERHAKEIYNYSFRLVGDWLTAEDLLSLTFLEAWRRRDKQLPEAKVLPWLFGIATNVARNRRRSDRRYAAALKRVPAPQPEPDFAERCVSRLDDERRMREAMAVLARLPAHEREVFVLCTCMGLSYDDAALALGVPIGTVRSRLSRARTHLRELESACGHEEERAAILEEVV